MNEWVGTGISLFLHSQQWHELKKPLIEKIIKFLFYFLKATE